jgi:hypothetical protein
MLMRTICRSVWSVKVLPELSCIWAIAQVPVQFEAGALAIASLAAEATGSKKTLAVKTTIRRITLRGAREWIK